MKALSLPVLESRENLRTFLYHLKEIVDTQDRIAALIEEVDNALEKDPSGAARSLSFLEVEVFDHLGLHLAELRGPFSTFLELLYSPPSQVQGPKNPGG